MIGWFILLLIDFLFFVFISFKASFFFFIFITMLYIWKMGIFRGIHFQQSIFSHAEIYYIEYTGDYYQIYRELEKLMLIINKFNLSRISYSTFGFYYDNPKKIEASKCRAVIGIMKEIKNPSINSTLAKKEEGFIEYLVRNSFKKATIPETESLFAYFPYINPLSKVVGINKFYSTLDSSLQSEEFKKNFNMDRKKYKVSIEVYKGNTLFFYVPLKNHERFNLHSMKFN
jgi:hypothetical protein